MIDNCKVTQDEQSIMTIKNTVTSILYQNFQYGSLFFAVEHPDFGRSNYQIPLTKTNIKPSIYDNSKLFSTHQYDSYALFITPDKIIKDDFNTHGLIIKTTYLPDTIEYFSIELFLTGRKGTLVSDYSSLEESPSQIVQFYDFQLRKR
jgi:hypothetical protein